MMFSNDPVFAGQMVGMPAAPPRPRPAPPPAPRPQPRPPAVASRPVEVPPPDALGIHLDPEPAVTVPDPDALGIKLH